jgi:hypothetical protein
MGIIKEFRIKTKDGHLHAMGFQNNEYPGIDIEFVADHDNGENLSKPRILFEYPSDGKLRVLIWDDKDNEDYTREIEFDI